MARTGSSAFLTAALSSLEVSLSVSWIPRNCAVDPLHLRTADGQWEMVTSPPELYHLLGLMGKIVFCAPGGQLLHLFSVSQLIIGNETSNCRVISQLDVAGTLMHPSAA